MKKLLPFFPLIFISFLVSAQSDSDGYTLRGQIQEGSYDGYIFLNIGSQKDSVLVVDNQFEFTGYVEIPKQSSLHLDSDSYITWVYLENSEIELVLTYEIKEINRQDYHGLELIEITGSETALYQERYKEFYQANQATKNFGDLVYEELSILLKEYPSHPFSGQILGENVLLAPVLSLDQVFELYQLLDTAAQDAQYLNWIEIGIRNLSTYSVGKPFADFTLPDTQDESVSLEEQKGSITVVDFWASWCGPCRGKHPELIELYEKFKGENFKMIGVSIDQRKEDWLKAIEQDKLPWVNVWDEESVLSEEVGIFGIPFIYLLDEQGEIIASNPSLELLDKLLEERLSP